MSTIVILACSSAQEQISSGSQLDQIKSVGIGPKKAVAQTSIVRTLTLIPHGTHRDTQNICPLNSKLVKALWKTRCLFLLDPSTFVHCGGCAGSFPNRGITWNSLWNSLRTSILELGKSCRNADTSGLGLTRTRWPSRAYRESTFQ